MPSTTLAGVFPDPKPIHRRDFIKENVRSIKHMQGILQEAGVIQPRKTKPIHPALFKNIPRQIKSRENELRRDPIDLTPLKLSNSEEKSAKMVSSDLLDAKKSHSEEETAKPRAKHSNSNPNTSPSKSNSKSKVRTKPHSKSKLTKKNKKGLENALQIECKFTETAVQTEREEDMSKLYQTGIIKYPSRTQSSMTRTDHSPKRPGNHGDYEPHPESQVSDIMEQFNTLGISEEKDFIHKNMNNIKPKPAKPTSQKVLAQAPPGYKLGEVPKYLKEMRDHSVEEIDEECPPGHVMLPDEERRETLKVLRKSYAERIQELNMMPVRNDTLKMRKRKMDIESELNRLDQGIKVFQRPKVYVKMDMLKGS